MFVASGVTTSIPEILEVARSVSKLIKILAVHSTANVLDKKVYKKAPPSIVCFCYENNIFPLLSTGPNL
jgi:hypothetical protein